MYNSIQSGTVVAFGVTYFFAVFVLGLRYIQAFRIVHKMELDLAILTISCGTSLYYFVTLTNLMSHGWGRHFDTLTTADLILFNKDLLPNTVTYLITPSITKMAMLSVLFRINPSWIYRAGVIAIATAIFAYTLALTVITGAPCNPLKAGTTTCLTNVALAQAVLNIVSDFAVLIIPLPTIHSLNMGLKQKFTIGSIMAVGSGVVICSIVRLPYVLVLSKSSDVTYTEAILGIWSIIEINLGIICGTSMRLKPFIVTYFPKLDIFSSQRSAKRSYTPWKDVLSKSDKGQHSYQLHSIQQSSREPASSLASKSHHIHVRDEVKVHVESSRDYARSSDHRGNGRSGDDRSGDGRSGDDSSVELVQS
ncbi:hypothetical protein F503_02426 [Ophiostoma piceae UAMH 11346]|uniref:Rhodopsin domain-containing protein n=1 Tax=Ophiostoma piceae (strain UAMH 11346) TaxID=1262450 RepID=S3CIT2_OPHP1|nr:hypothetical protein F503_02426 [Ophiostoma piceae UAMH 11346]